MDKIGVFTSGGDSPGMNACVRAVVRTAIHRGVEVVGIMNGYEGMMNAEFVNMSRSSVSDIVHRGGTILKSARSERFRTKEGRALAYENLKKEGINSIVAIGGDGTLTGAKIFLEEYPDFKIIGCPGTIDNDLGGTDFTIGYDTAINTAMEAVDKIKDTAAAHNRLFFIEVMGRHAGFIALETGIATGAEAILVPESKTELDRLVEFLKRNYERGNSSIVIVAEGEEEGGAYKIAQKVKEKFDKYDSRVSVLGHIQRGGSPTCMERVRASRMGAASVEALLAGESGKMAGIIHNDIVLTPFETVLNVENRINPELLQLAEILAC